MFKILLLVAVIVGVGFHIAKDHKMKKLNPEVIDKPVYLHIGLKRVDQQRTVDGVFLVQAASQDDCEGHATYVMKGFRAALEMVEKEHARMVAAAPPGTGEPIPKPPTISFADHKCEETPTTRNARLFENSPTHVTFLSASRSKRTERETRMIFWGISVQESTDLCNAMIKRYPPNRATCVAARS